MRADVDKSRQSACRAAGAWILADASRHCSRSCRLPAAPAGAAPAMCCLRPQVPCLCFTSVQYTACACEAVDRTAAKPASSRAGRLLGTTRKSTSGARWLWLCPATLPQAFTSQWNPAFCLHRCQLQLALLGQPTAVAQPASCFAAEGPSQSAIACRRLGAVARCLAWECEPGRHHRLARCWQCLRRRHCQQMAR